MLCPCKLFLFSLCYLVDSANLKPSNSVHVHLHLFVASAPVIIAFPADFENSLIILLCYLVDSANLDLAIAVLVVLYPIL